MEYVFGILSGLVIGMFIGAFMQQEADRSYVATQKKPRRNRRWAKEWHCCWDCDTRSRPHHGRGLCRRCYTRQYKRPSRRK